MAYAFEFEAEHCRQPQSRRRRVLVTGAAGRIGAFFARTAHEHYDLTLMVRDAADPAAAALAGLGRVVAGDLGDLARLKELFAGQDSIVHLAASASAETVWSTLLENNIQGTYNTFVAARAAACRRVVFASSIHAVSGYPAGTQVHPHDPVCPGDVYGVSKCFGEALGRFMAVEQGLSVLVIRIGAFQPVAAARDPENLRLMNTFVSRRDLAQLIRLCIDDQRLRFAIFHGLSRNPFNRMDIAAAEELLGYAPEDDFTEQNRALHDLDLAGRVQPHDEEAGQESGLREDL